MHVDVDTPGDGLRAGDGRGACVVVRHLAKLATMRSVRIGELKNHLSRYLRVVRGGTRLVVMDRDVPVAELGPITSAGKAASDRREDLVRSGVLIPAPRGSLTLDELGPPVPCRGDVVAALRADRDAR
jgi:antitoxin (DNA-binding transcriptional repressor) of toxin-antitoxin stability system